MTIPRSSSDRPWGLLASLLIFATFAFSCGSDDGLGKRYPVSGTVTYKDQPVPKGSISFVPDDPKTTE